MAKASIRQRHASGKLSYEFWNLDHWSPRTSEIVVEAKQANPKSNWNVRVAVKSFGYNTFIVRRGLTDLKAWQRTVYEECCGKAWEILQNNFRRDGIDLRQVDWKLQLTWNLSENFANA